MKVTRCRNGSMRSDCRQAHLTQRVMQIIDKHLLEVDEHLAQEINLLCQVTLCMCAGSCSVERHC